MKILNKKTAERHVDEMQRSFQDQIKDSFEHSRVLDGYAGLRNRLPHINQKPVIVLRNTDSVTATLDEAETRDTCVLNFASYKHPGGGYLLGSIAQEECLCAKSTLYNVLKLHDDSFYKENRESKTNSLYKNRAIYAGGIRFEDNGRAFPASVLTCAAPNWGTAQSEGVKKEENLAALRDRVAFILYIIAHFAPESAVLGAFGCGVFGQQPDFVAKTFLYEILRLYEDCDIRLVFAIPKGKNGNYDAFRQIFEESKEKLYDRVSFEILD